MNITVKTKSRRNYTPPIFHLEALDSEECMEVVMQMIDGLETANIAFAAVFYNEVQDNINVHTYNMSDRESKAIYKDIRSIEELSDYDITLN